MSRYRKEIPGVFKNKSGYYCFWYWVGDKRKHKSTGCKHYNNAKRYVVEFMNKERGDNNTLEKVGKDFFLWEKCPIINFLHQKGRSFSKDHAYARRRQWFIILEKFGGKVPHELKGAEIDAWLLSTAYSGQTRNHILQAGKTAFEYLDITPNPFDGLKKFSVNAKQRGSLSKKEVQMMFHPIQRLTWGGTKWYAIFNTLVKTGLRSGELRALKWENIDFEDEVIYVLHSANSDNEQVKTKTESSQRVVPMIDNTKVVLSEWKRQSEASAEEDFVFYGRYPTKMISKRAICAQFSSVLPSFSFLQYQDSLVVHSLRHTYISLIRPHLQAQGHERVLQQLSGHSTDRMVDHYSHDQLQYRIQALHDAVEGFSFEGKTGFPEILEEEEEQEQDRSPSNTWALFDL